MSDAPTVSVLMTAYNRAKYIGMAIESVLASTFRDFELVVVDDGSTDKTQDIAKGFATRDSRIRFHQNETILGDYPNRNRAASLARGKWLKYVDSDDYIYPHGLEVLVSTMHRFPDAGYGLCSFPALRDTPYPIRLSPREAYRRHYFESSLFHRAPLSAIILQSAWEAVGGFPTERMTSDMGMWHRLSKRFPVVLMAEGVVWYRAHSEQEVGDLAARPGYWALRYQAVTEQALLDPDIPLTLAERQSIARRLWRADMMTILKLLAKQSFADVRGYLAQAQRFRALSTRNAPTQSASPVAVEMPRGTSSQRPD
jgi:glycosyltransferase involved in cell wall biosynthesis